jgi:predicted phosphodiesterase
MKNNILVLLLLFTGLFSSGINKTLSYSINQLELSVDSIQSDFSFITLGHVYGYPSYSIFPAPGLISNVAKITSSDASFVMMLGDNYRLADSINIATFKQTFLNKMTVPVFNAIGNHDLYDRNGLKEQDYPTYKKHFSKFTYYSFIKNSSLFVVLDTELNSKDQGYGTIHGEQLVFLKKVLQDFSSLKSSNTKNVFICGHKELVYFEGNNYHKDIKPLLSSLTNDGIQVYVLSGDIAKEAYDLYLVKDTNPNITYVHTHLYDEEGDKILKFNISKTGLVSYIPISLYDLPIKEHYTQLKDDRYIDPASIIVPPEPSVIQKIGYRFINQQFYEGIIFLIICIAVFTAVRKYKKKLSS